MRLSATDSGVPDEGSTALASLIALVCTACCVSSVTPGTAAGFRVGDSVSEKAWTTVGLSGAMLSASDSVFPDEGSTTLASLIALVCTTGWVASVTSETADLLRVGDSVSEKAWTTLGISGVGLCATDSKALDEGSISLASLIALVCTTGWADSVTSGTAAELG